MYIINYTIPSQLQKIYRSSLNYLSRAYFFVKDIINIPNSKPGNKISSTQSTNNKIQKQVNLDTINQNLLTMTQAQLTNSANVGAGQTDVKDPNANQNNTNNNPANSNSINKNEIVDLLDSNKKEIESEIKILNIKIDHIDKSLSDISIRQSNELKCIDNVINSKLNRYDMTNKVLGIENEVLCMANKIGLYTSATFVCCCLFLFIIAINSYYISGRKENSHRKY